jgi:hypothetical protein
VDGHLHALATLSLGKQSLAPIVLETGWASKLVLIVWTGEPIHLLDIELQILSHPACSLVAVLGYPSSIHFTVHFVLLIYRVFNLIL